LQFNIPRISWQLKIQPPSSVFYQTTLVSEEQAELLFLMRYADGAQLASLIWFILEGTDVTAIMFIRMRTHYENKSQAS
jgi:hypothetical protein